MATKAFFGGLITVLILLVSCQPSQDKALDTETLFTLLSPRVTGVDFKNPIEENKE